MENEIALFENRTEMYTSFHATNHKEEIAFFNAINSDSKKLADEINETISVRDVYVEMVTMTDEETGETSTAPRTVFIDDKLVGHSCVSMGIFSACKKLFAIKGTPDTWAEPVKIKIIGINKGKRRILTFTLV